MKTQKTTEIPVLLTCPDCAEIGMLINLWHEPGIAWAGICGSVPHNTPATLIATRVVKGVKFHRVVVGELVGWVTFRLITRLPSR